MLRLAEIAGRQSQIRQRPIGPVGADSYQQGGKISKRRAGRPSLIHAADSHAALPPALPVPEALANPVAGRDRLSNRGIDIARPVRSAAWWSGISARIRIAAGSVIIARLCNRG